MGGVDKSFYPLLAAELLRDVRIGPYRVVARGGGFRPFLPLAGILQYKTATDYLENIGVPEQFRPMLRQQYLLTGKLPTYSDVLAFKEITQRENLLSNIQQDPNIPDFVKRVAGLATADQLMQIIAKSEMWKSAGENVLKLDPESISYFWATDIHSAYRVVHEGLNRQNVISSLQKFYPSLDYSLYPTDQLQKMANLVAVNAPILEQAQKYLTPEQIEHFKRIALFVSPDNFSSAITQSIERQQLGNIIKEMPEYLRSRANFYLSLGDHKSVMDTIKEYFDIPYALNELKIEKNLFHAFPELRPFESFLGDIEQGIAEGKLPPSMAANSVKNLREALTSAKSIRTMELGVQKERVALTKSIIDMIGKVFSYGVEDIDKRLMRLEELRLKAINPKDQAALNEEIEKLKRDREERVKEFEKFVNMITKKFGVTFPTEFPSLFKLGSESKQPQATGSLGLSPSGMAVLQEMLKWAKGDKGQ